MKADMEQDGRSQTDVAAVEPLFKEVQTKVHSAILRPTVRTQYQRAAFHIPFDATVRISLDTNLRMYKELPDNSNPLWRSDWGRCQSTATPAPASDSPVSSSDSLSDDSIGFLAWRSYAQIHELEICFRVVST